MKYKFLDDLMNYLGIIDKDNLEKDLIRDLLIISMDSSCNEDKRKWGIWHLKNSLNNKLLRGYPQGRVLCLEVQNNGKPEKYNITYFPKATLPVPFDLTKSL